MRSQMRSTIFHLWKAWPTSKNTRTKCNWKIARRRQVRTEDPKQWPVKMEQSGQKQPQQGFWDFRLLFSVLQENWARSDSLPNATAPARKSFLGQKRQSILVLRSQSCKCGRSGFLEEKCDSSYVLECQSIVDPVCDRKWHPSKSKCENFTKIPC